MPGLTTAVAALIGAATGVKPYFIGKPNPLMMRMALRTLGAHSEDSAIIGDRMDSEYHAFRRSLGLTVQRMYLQQTLQEDKAIFYLEGDDLQRAFQKLGTSQDPFAVWFRQRAKDLLNGLDLTQTSPASLSELVFAKKSGSSAPSLVEESMQQTRAIPKHHSRSGVAPHPDALQPPQVTARGRDRKAQQDPRRESSDSGRWGIWVEVEARVALIGGVQASGVDHGHDAEPQPANQRSNQQDAHRSQRQPALGGGQKNEEADLRPKQQSNPD